MIYIVHDAKVQLIFISQAIFLKKIVNLGKIF